MRRLLLLASSLLLLACGPDDAPDAPRQPAESARTRRLEDLLGALAHDSTLGRRTGTPENHEVAAFLAGELASYGVRPGTEAGFFQPVPLARMQGRLVLPSPDLDFDTLAPSTVLGDEVNVVGIIPGTDPERSEEAVVIGAHYDHLGAGAPADGDSIFNGADDDGTGTVAILEIARALAADPPARTVVVLLSTAEEQGLLGTRWYLQRPAVPLERTVADFQIEMIGRPDSLAGGAGRGWLTGYERTTMGEQLAKAGSPIVADPRPEMRFFFRSDNLPFAARGIPAHTLSSYGMHTDYHQPSDEIGAVDFSHMTALVDAAEEAVRFLADGPEPEWVEGGREGLPDAP